MTSVVFGEGGRYTIGEGGVHCIDEGVIMDAVRAWLDTGSRLDDNYPCLLPYGRAGDGDLHLVKRCEQQRSVMDDEPIPVTHIYTAATLDYEIITMDRLRHYTTGEVMEWLQRETLLPMRLYDGNGVAYILKPGSDSTHTYDATTGTFEPVEWLDGDDPAHERLGWRYLWHGRIDRRIP